MTGQALSVKWGQWTLEDALSTARRLGWVMFAADYGTKGQGLPKGWTTMGVTEAALRLERDQGRKKGRFNPAARTGPNLGAIDIDGHNGTDPKKVGERLMAVLPQGTPLMQTGRGYRFVFRPKEIVGDGPLPSEYGGEVYTAGHLIILPPSRHPNGQDYLWVIPPDGDLPVVDLAVLGLVPQRRNGHRPQTQSFHVEEGAPPAETPEYLRELAHLTGGHCKREGRWWKLRCPFHQDSTPSLGVVNGSEWAQCFSDRCGIRLPVRRIVSILKGDLKLHGNFISEDAEQEQQRVREALQSLGLPLAREMEFCGRYLKVYHCGNCGERPAFWVSCKSPFCPRCRRRRLAAHLAQKHDLFDSLAKPLVLTFKAAPLAPSHATEGREQAQEQTQDWVKYLRGLRGAIPALRDTLRGFSPACRNGMLQVTHFFVFEGTSLDHKARVRLVHALREKGAEDVSLEEAQDGDAASAWLLRRVSRFDFETAEDLVTLLTAFKGLSILRGWGEFRPATGGMLKGKAPAPKPTCPFCGAELGKPIGEVPADEVQWVDGKGWRVRGPPTTRQSTDGLGWAQG